MTTQGIHAFISTHQSGKSKIMSDMEKEFLKKNPKATLMRTNPEGEVVIEKFIGSNR